ncbi:hypothetical protein A3195_19400 [Candidatus Thiodiazotropha endoloripes]|uniref:PD40 domain-containing protein n=1 Tax=Candidatus Thiodiazotropha endoloripes TaxID=1818881 RepID=UPI00083DB2B2|nr:PD40 domain-containing protein [Candidatus Thiodiazotropha endoloripes]ODB82793.1 hypothetical protein A3193_18775 [Candidatus Thiodiazotropha endoloripes]ODB82986.1 hypothetical protein A3195_19400 [Candidatus Thiodiazotropha endoloripes]
MPKMKIIKYLLILIISHSLVGCGGGGSSGDVGDDSNPGDGNVNGGLAGKIFTQDGWIIDIPTGKGKRVPGILWDSYCLDFDVVGDDFYCTDPVNTYGRHPNYNAFPSSTGDKYIVAINDCVEGYSLDCIEMYNTNTGEMIGERYELYQSVDIAKFSKNGNYYAYTFSDEAYTDSPTLLIINNVNNEEISFTVMPDDGPISFEWTNDNRLVYAYNGGIYVTSPYSTEGTSIFFMRDYPELSDYIGIGGAVRVSPDGERIAFNLFKSHLTGSYTPQTPWVINIDGTDFHRFANRESENGDGAEVFGSLAWSPDGRYILLIEGYIPSGLFDSWPGSLYAVPSDSRNVKINDEGKDGIIRLKTNYKNDSKDLRYRFDDAVFMWIQ